MRQDSFSGRSTAPDPGGTLGPGSRLGRYEILAPLARGGMAYVWAARFEGAPGFAKIVALKTILPELEGDEDLREMLYDEALIAAQIQHPNCCTTLELGQTDDLLYLAMEWVDGDSLSKLHKAKGKEPIDVRIAARIVAQVCAGIHAAHELRDETGALLSVVHRDVTPQNILVSVTGHVKVTDFGVAKALGRRQRSSQVGTIKGKLAYAAPEYVKDGLIDRRADIYSAGIVLYELTTSKRPFEGRDEFDTLERTFAGTATPPSSVRPGYPRELEAIVMRAIARDPAKRYQRAEEMRAALESWLAKSGPILMEHDVARLVEARLGPLIAERNQPILAAMRERSQASIPPLSTRPRPPAPTFTETGETEVVVSLLLSKARRSPTPPSSQATHSKPPPLPSRASPGTAPTRASAAAPHVDGPGSGARSLPPLRLSHRELAQPTFPRPAPLPDLLEAAGGSPLEDPMPPPTLASPDGRWMVIGDEVKPTDELTLMGTLARMKPRRGPWIALGLAVLVVVAVASSFHGGDSPANDRSPAPGVSAGPR